MADAILDIRRMIFPNCGIYSGICGLDNMYVFGMYQRIKRTTDYFVRTITEDVFNRRRHINKLSRTIEGEDNVLAVFDNQPVLFFTFLKRFFDLPVLGDIPDDANETDK